MAFNLIKNAFSNYLISFKCLEIKSFGNYFIEKFIDRKNLDLKNKIKSEFVIEDFHEFLSYFGLNYTVKTNERFWSHFLLICYFIQIAKLIAAYLIDPIQDIDYLIYLFDVSLLFQSLRKYLLIFLIISFSMAFHVNYLFNHNSNIKWQQLFKCLDDHLSPDSIQVKNKDILVKVLIFTKFSFKSSKYTTNLLTFVVVIFGFYQFLNKLYFKIIRNILTVITTIFWIPTIAFSFWLLIGSIVRSVICFEIICFYCFLN